MHLIAFTNGSSTTEFVGKKSGFKDAADFLEACKGEFDWKFDEIDFAVNPDDVFDGVYCRYYPRMPADMSHLDLESGYTFCDKQRGAFEVYVLPWEKHCKERAFG